MTPASAQIVICTEDRGLSYTLHAFSKKEAAVIVSTIPGISALGADMADLLRGINMEGSQCYLNPNANVPLPGEVYRFELSVISKFATTGEMDEKGEWYSVLIPGQSVLRVVLRDTKKMTHKAIQTAMYPTDDAESEAKQLRMLLGVIGHSIHSYLDPTQKNRYTVSADGTAVAINREWVAPEEPVLFPA